MIGQSHITSYFGTKTGLTIFILVVKTCLNVIFLQKKSKPDFEALQDDEEMP